MLIMALPFYACISMLVLERLYVFSGICYVGWTLLFGFFAYATGVRNSIREKYEINGNVAEDFFAVMVLYPFAAYQMEHHMKNHKPTNHIQNGHCLPESCCIPLGEMEKLMDPDARKTDV